MIFFSFPQDIEQLHNLGEHNEKDLISIEGLSYRINGNIQHNPVLPPIKDIDSLHFTQRDLISLETYKQYYRIGLKRSSDVIITSRGCPFSCKFCYSLTPGYRSRSPGNVLTEIGKIYKRSRGLSIVDDNFTVNRKRCITILEGVLKNN